jgi:muconate cycloisomerase
MPDLAIRPSLAPDLWAGLRIAEVLTAIVDIPTRRPHKLSSLSTSEQNYVLVRVRTGDGVEGIGEAATLGGPRWSEESVEAIKANIDTYLAPAILGERADLFELLGARMDQAAKRNNAAKSAVESALFDAVGKTLGVSAATLLGGAVRDRIRVLWTLASGDPEQEVAEAEEKLALRRHNIFKVKLGAQTPRADMKRMERIASALEGRAELIVDANQGWSETVARRCLDQMDGMGVTLVEQPLPAWDLAGMARLRAACKIPLMADESIFSPDDAFAVGRAGAADVVSLKLVKHGGLLGTRKVAAVCEAAGIGLYGGCLLESSVGAAAHLQVFSTLRRLDWHCEHFGPQILSDDLLIDPVAYDAFDVLVPQGHGLGITLDEDKVRQYTRKG